MLFQGKDHSTTYLDLVPKPFEQPVSLEVSTQRLEGELPNSSYGRCSYFLVFTV